MNTRPSPLIRLENVCKEFDGFYLDSVSIDLYPGEVHILVGENGSGKSTLMKLLAGWFPPESGTFFLKGKPARFRNLHDARKMGILYLHQEIQCFENLSVAENVFFGLMPRLWGIPQLYDSNRLLSDCGKVFRELGITILPDQILSRLGFAERQLVAAATGYVNNSEIVIFDEPSSAMSVPEREILFDIIARLKARGTAIFYISHRLDEISRVGDRVSVMQKGRITGTIVCSDVDQDGLVRLMTGDVLKKRYPRLPSKRGRVVLSVQDLKFDPILKGVSFDLRQGEILGITGLMGSGRTLLANCLFGVTTPSGGEVVVRGRPVKFNHPGDAMENGISLIPEDRIKNGIFDKHSLQRNMTSATLRRFLNRFFLDIPFMNELTREYVKIMKIVPGRQNDVIRNYSGGNQQKIMLSKWLMNRSMIYIMDEPTRGIDAASKIDIYNTMNDLVAKGAAIILISSEIEETLGMSDRILVLAGGRIAREMTWEEATKENILAAATLDD